MTEQVAVDTAKQVQTIESRVAQAMDIVKRNMLWSAGAGVVPVPAVELVAITAVEVKMVKELADFYHAHFNEKVTFKQELATTAVLSLISSLGSVTLGKMVALSAMRALPVIGQAVALASVPGMAAAITYGIGRVFVSHFEAGGTLLDFNPKSTLDFFKSEVEKAKAQPHSVVV